MTAKNLTTISAYTESTDLVFKTVIFYSSRDTIPLTLKRGSFAYFLKINVDELVDGFFTRFKMWQPIAGNNTLQTILPSKSLIRLIFVFSDLELWLTCESQEPKFFLGFKLTNLFWTVSWHHTDPRMCLEHCKHQSTRYIKFYICNHQRTSSKSNKKISLCTRICMSIPRYFLLTIELHCAKMRTLHVNYSLNRIK